jgi:hypothetical protein
MKRGRKLVLLGAFFAILTGIAGCLKAGDGVGLKEDGQPDPCVVAPNSKACTTYTCRNNDTTLAMCKVKTGLSFALKIYPLLEDKTPSGCYTCHGVSTGVGIQFLDMTSSTTAYNNLVNKLVWGQSTDITRTPAPGWVRVKPRFPDSSMLYLKLKASQLGEGRVQFDSANYPKGYGGPMPLAGSAFKKEALDLIRQWILDGALP